MATIEHQMVMLLLLIWKYTAWFVAVMNEKETNVPEMRKEIDRNGEKFEKIKVGKTDEMPRVQSNLAGKRSW